MAPHCPQDKAFEVSLGLEALYLAPAHTAPPHALWSEISLPSWPQTEYVGRLSTISIRGLWLAIQRPYPASKASQTQVSSEG